MPFKDGAIAKQYRIDYYQKNKTKRKEWRTEYHLKKKIIENTKNREYYNKHKEEKREYKKQYELNTRKLVIEAYGSICVCCNEDKQQFLCIDHINNDGAKHRKELNIRAGFRFYRWLIKNNYPKDKFQLLCHNCNMVKHIYGKCLHGQFSYQLTAQHKRKFKIMEHYGNSCRCCGISELAFLSINHKNGNGRVHLKNNKISGASQFYSWIIKNNYPDNLEILCYNCNVSSGLYGYCHKSVGE